MATQKESSRTRDFIFAGIITVILILFAGYESANSRLNQPKEISDISFSELPENHSLLQAIQAGNQ